MTQPDARAERTEPATGEDVARMFHETYERLAPEYGYRTREDSAKPWDEVPEQNRALMVATVTEVLAALDLPGRVEALREDAKRWAAALIEGREDWRRRAEEATADLDAAQHRAYVAEDKLALAEIHLAEAQADRDGTARSLAAVQEGQQRIASDWERMRTERDAANAALADVARLLDEAREEIKRLQRQVDLLTAYDEAYWATQTELDRLLGTEEDDGSGAGLAAEVRLLGEQRDDARAEAERWKSLAMKLMVQTPWMT